MLRIHLEILHQQALPQVGVESRELLSRMFSFLTFLENVQSEPSFEESLIAIWREVETSYWLDAAVDAENLTDMARICYATAILETVETCWPYTYGRLPNDNPILPVLAWLRSKVDRSLVAGWLQQVEQGWSGSGSIVRNAFLLQFVYRCLQLKILASNGLYLRINKLLSFEHPFVVVYLAALCMKSEAIAHISAFELEQSPAQYACMQMLDTFPHLPGLGCG